MHVAIVVNLAPAWSFVMRFLDFPEARCFVISVVNRGFSFNADTKFFDLAFYSLNCNFFLPSFDKFITPLVDRVSLVNTVLEHAFLSQAVTLLVGKAPISRYPLIAITSSISEVSVSGCFRRI